MQAVTYLMVSSGCFESVDAEAAERGCFGAIAAPVSHPERHCHGVLPGHSGLGDLNCCIPSTNATFSSNWSSKYSSSCALADHLYRDRLSTSEGSLAASRG